MREKIHFKIYRILLYIFAFALPFSTPSLMYLRLDHSYFNVTPLLLGLFLLNWLFEANFKTKFQRIRENKLTFPFVAMVSFYLLYVIGLTYSTNLDFAGKDILLKVPFLLFPLLIFTANPSMWKPKMAQNLLFTFALGSLFALIVSLINSFLRCGETLSIDYFLYGRASLFFHPSYASQYYCFSFIIILYFLINKQLHSWKKIIAWLMFLLFPMEIVLLNSRTGLLAFVIILLVFASYIFIFNWKKSLRFIAYMSVLVCILVASLNLVPEQANRLFTTINNLFNKEVKTLNNTTESKTEQPNKNAMFGRIDVARTQVWESAVEVIRDHPILGVGTGDIKEALMEKYIKHDFPVAQEKNLNAHNQFLQVTVTLGFVGLAVFLAVIASIFWISWKKRSILLLLFGLLCAINFWTESMFEKQIGVMFFAFFFALLCYISTTNLLKEEQNTENRYKK